MLTVNKGESNTVILTLKEKEIHAFQTFVFIFRSLDSDKNYVTTIPKTDNESLYQERYDKFTIIENDSPNLLAGEITLGVEGMYYYSVYSINISFANNNQVRLIEQMTQDQIDSYVNYCLEKGVCYVQKELTETPTYTPDVINVTTYQPT